MALGVLNYNNRHSSHGFVPWKDARTVLDEFSRQNPDTVVASFWLNASNNQIALLRREYNRTK